MRAGEGKGGCAVKSWESKGVPQGPAGRPVVGAAGASVSSPECPIKQIIHGVLNHPGGNPWAILKPISHKSYPREVAFKKPSYP